MAGKEGVEKDLGTLIDKEYGYVKAGYPKFMRLF